MSVNPENIPPKEMDMNLVTCVQMVAGRMKLENHFVTNVKSDMSQERKELPVVMAVVSTMIFQRI